MFCSAFICLQFGFVIFRQMEMSTKAAFNPVGEIDYWVSVTLMTSTMADAKPLSLEFLGRENHGCPGVCRTVFWGAPTKDFFYIFYSQNPLLIVDFVLKILQMWSSWTGQLSSLPCCYWRPCATVMVRWFSLEWIKFSIMIWRREKFFLSWKVGCFSHYNLCNFL